MKTAKDYLGEMTFEVSDQVYVFATTTLNTLATDEEPIMRFKEKEGFTYILTRSTADVLALKYSLPCKMFSLNVETPLELIGFMVLIAKALADVGASCNVVSGYYHDHIFIGLEHEEVAIKAMDALRDGSNAGKS